MQSLGSVTFYLVLLAVAFMNAFGSACISFGIGLLLENVDLLAS